ncbi:PBP1A family penicillin-binding protein [Paenibacillus sp. TRM 82003]|nr:PBP1A family penicillin-binding protein [Paenibacillus sp. TRM 82003]
MSLLTLGLFLFIAGYFFIYLNGQKLLEANMQKFRVAEASVVLDRNGHEYTKFYLQNRELVTLEEIPDRLEEAIVATEDQRFYEHAGVDFWSIGRAIVKDIIARDLVEGGSTITQQLAKNMFLTADKTFFRKATEVSIAVALETTMDKDLILQYYLNYIYMGNGAYGMQSAAEKHFGKELADLDLLEIAVLAGMPKAPETYSPTNDPERAVERAAIVLSLMKEQGYITEEERRAALNDKLEPPAPRGERVASAMRDYILAQAVEVTGLPEQELRIGGYRIYTTVDNDAQQAVDKAFTNPELFPEDGPEQISQGAMVIIDPHTGGIAAMSGGREYVDKGLNRALARRQPGSSFKPVAVYAPALETGDYHPYSMLKDEKMSFGNYSPSNLSGKYAGQMTMTEAVQRSINLPAVWLLNEIGVAKGLEYAKKLGIEMSSEDRNLAIALGGLTNGASPLEMARAYGAFANDGMLAETFVITKIEMSDGHKVYEHKPKSSRVMSEQAAYYMTTMLETVTKKGGTGTKAAFGRPVAGKTGTTQPGLKGVKDSAGNRDIWFVGYTPQYAAAVWMGFDQTDAKHFVKSGSGTAAAMFAAVMKDAMAKLEVQDFRRPEGVSEPKKEQPPAAVSDLTASFNPEMNVPQVQWSPVGANGVEYRLYRKEASEAAPTQLLQTPQTSVDDFTALPGMTYQYYVTVVTVASGLESAPSNSVDVLVPEIVEDDGMTLPEVLPGEEPSTDEEGGSGDGGEFGGEDGGNDSGEPDGDGGNGTNGGDGNGTGTEGDGTDGGESGTGNGGAEGGEQPPAEGGAEPPAEPTEPDPVVPLPEPGTVITPEGL